MRAAPCRAASPQRPGPAWRRGAASRRWTWMRSSGWPAASCRHACYGTAQCSILLLGGQMVKKRVCATRTLVPPPARLALPPPPVGHGRPLRLEGCVSWSAGTARMRWCRSDRHSPTGADAPFPVSAMLAQRYRAVNTARARRGRAPYSSAREMASASERLAVIVRPGTAAWSPAVRRAPGRG